MTPCTGCLKKMSPRCWNQLNNQHTYSCISILFYFFGIRFNLFHVLSFQLNLPISLSLYFHIITVFWVPWLGYLGKWGIENRNIFLLIHIYVILFPCLNLILVSFIDTIIFFLCDYLIASLFYNHVKLNLFCIKMIS